MECEGWILLTEAYFLTIHICSDVECEANIFNRIYIMNFVHWEFEYQSIIKWHLWSLLSCFFSNVFWWGRVEALFFLEVKDSILYKVKWVNRVLTLHFRWVISKELFSNFISLWKRSFMEKKRAVKEANLFFFKKHFSNLVNLSALWWFHRQKFSLRAFKVPCASYVHYQR